jgi:hypothetical protein
MKTCTLAILVLLLSQALPSGSEISRIVSNEMCELAEHASDGCCINYMSQAACSADRTIENRFTGKLQTAGTCQQLSPCLWDRCSTCNCVPRQTTGTACELLTFAGLASSTPRSWTVPSNRSIINNVQLSMTLGLDFDLIFQELDTFKSEVVADISNCTGLTRKNIIAGTVVRDDKSSVLGLGVSVKLPFEFVSGMDCFCPNFPKKSVICLCVSWSVCVCMTNIYVKTALASLH